jgi:hypothetical protein
MQVMTWVGKNLQKMNYHRKSRTKLSGTKVSYRKETDKAELVRIKNQK